jgi:ATP-binding cassette subfamily B protein
MRRPVPPVHQAEPSASRPGSASTVGIHTLLAWGLPYLKQHAGRTSVALFFLLAAKVATVAVPLFLQAVVNGLVPQEGSDGTWTRSPVLVLPWALLIAYGAMRFSATLFRELQSVVFAGAQHGIMRDMSVQVLRHLHQLPLRFHLARRTGAIARDIGRGTSSVSTLLNYLLFNIVPTLVEVALVSGILIWGYSPRFAGVVVVTFVAYVLLTFGLTQWRIRFRTEMNDRDSRASADAIDGLINYETVKYFNNEEFELNRYDASLRAWALAATRSQNSMSLLNVGQGAIIAVGVTVLMLMAAGDVASGRMNVGELVAVNAFLLQVFLPLGFLGTVYSILRQSAADVERMFGLLHTPTEIVDPARPQALPDGPLAVAFEGVHFGYEADRVILHGLQLQIAPGEHVAVVGASGAGKSTLARLLFRFYDVQQGTVRVGGRDVRVLPQDALRRAIGIVPQDCVLFNDTLAFNLRYARLDASDDDLREAARQAGILPFIESLPQGWDTLVGERGLKLSGGEKQRVGIARALLKAPRILVFDEATSSLDSATEQTILTHMKRAAHGRTSLTIAHRLSTITDADRIVVLRDGRVSEEGRHADLLARGGDYAELWRLQSSA